MSESFKELFEQSFSGVSFYPGAIIPAKVINDVLDTNQITRVLPGRYNTPAYKRLASRAYQLLSTEVNHIYRNSTSTG